MTMRLELENVGKKLSPLPEQWLFRDFTASITEPEIIGILGKSGQGKSTLLRILGRLTKADCGAIRLQSKDMSLWEPEAWRMTMSYVAQQPVMLSGSVEDNLRITSTLHQRPFDEKLARDYMEQLAMSHIDWGKNAVQLSGGEKQRLALIRSLLLRPSILLLDEVTSSLDTVSKQAAERLLVQLHTRLGTTLLWITHDLDEARSACNRIWFMANGHLEEDSPSQAFFRSPQTLAARDFLNRQASHAPVYQEEQS
nr:ATP-binding cassette domain-containing protein [Brevibacillus choshinensis]